MHLFELSARPAAARLAAAANAGVPAWALGCFRRRSITFFNGAEDTETVVLWLQSRGLTADFRRRPPTPSVPSPAALRELPLPQLLGLARVEGGLASTRWDGQLMSWSGWTSFQTHAKWPEPGRLERVGTSLVEFAPSGAYVEDWRYQPAGDGPLIGLSLIDERDVESGAVLHRGGGLIVCGRHAAFVRGRAEALPEGTRLDEYVQSHASDAAALARVFAFDASYATAHAGSTDYRVDLSTLPWRERQPLLSLEGFDHDAAAGNLLQRVEDGGRRIERRFTIDTLEPSFAGIEATPADPAAVEWLKLEAETLLATLT